MAPEILDLGWLQVRGYGLMIGIGIPLACLAVLGEARRRGLEALDRHFAAVFCAMAVAIFLGGKLAFVVGYPEDFADLRRRVGAAAFFRDGFVFYGSVLLAVPTAVLLLRRLSVPVLAGLDTLCLGACLLHGFGRLGCFLAGCCYGTTHEGACSVTFHHGQGLNGVPLHPVQLYEAAGIFAVFLFLWLRRRHAARFEGHVVLSWLVLYAVVRLVTEAFRGDGNPVVVSLREGTWSPGAPPLGLTLAQVTSLVILAITLPLLARGLRRGRPEA